MDGPDLDDNTVQYRLYPFIKPGRSSREFLTTYITDAISKLAKHLTGYIWHQEPFNLRVVEDAVHQGPHIEGRTCFGDNVEDEWFIVFLLLELTRADPELVVKCEDNDGEFLLIEAADSGLPRWAERDPDACENRCYLFQSELHLIPMRKGPLPSGVPLIPEAVRAIRSYKHESRCSEPIQTAIQKRIRGYPGSIREFQQRIIGYVPAGVGALLDADPTLISAAVGAFYSRDPIDLAACRVMKYFPPENRVMKLITLTRCQYGQLMGQKYTPDRKIGWDIPPANAPTFKAYDLGMKIACGFEMLAAAAANKQPNNGESAATDSDVLEQLEQDHRWQRFVSNLDNNGYFQNLLKGSAGYTKLLKEAQSFYLKSVISTIGSGDSLRSAHGSRADVGRRILALIDTVEIDYEKLKRESKNLVEDDDRWMHLSSNDFDEILKQKFLGNTSMQELGRKVPDTLNSFLGGESGVDGIVAPTPKTSQRKPAKDRPSPNSEAEENSKLSFEPENFSEAIRSVLTLQVPHTDSDASSSSGMSDYSDESDTHSISEEEQDSLDVNRSSSKPAKITAKKRRPAKNGTSDNGGADSCEKLVGEMKSYMDQMDRELAKTKVGESFERKKPPLATGEDDFDDEDEYRPVDMDLNALKNILESFNSQQGLPGPSSSIFESMGVYLPRSNGANGSGSGNSSESARRSS